MYSTRTLLLLITYAVKSTSDKKRKQNVTVLSKHYSDGMTETMLGQVNVRQQEST